MLRVRVRVRARGLGLGLTLTLTLTLSRRRGTEEGAGREMVDNLPTLCEFKVSNPNPNPDPDPNPNPNPSPNQALALYDMYAIDGGAAVVVRANPNPNPSPAHTLNPTLIPPLTLPESFQTLTLTRT